LENQPRGWAYTDNRRESAEEVLFKERTLQERDPSETQRRLAYNIKAKQP